MERLGTGLFTVERADQAPAWVAELNGDHVPETEEYGISSVVYRDHRPFQPQRLWRFISTDFEYGKFGKALLSKGFFRLASRPGTTGLWSQAGTVSRFEPLGVRTSEDTGTGQEPVFIGTEPRPDALRAALSDRVLTERELAEGAAHWPRYPDPFPEWT